MIKYDVRFTASAAKELKALNPEIKQKIIPVIDSLEDNPLPKGVTKLKGFEMLFRIRLGQYRIVYIIDNKNKRIKVTRIRHRHKAYQQLP